MDTISRKRIREDIEKYLKPFVTNLRKKFRIEQPESSADSVTTHESHLIFLDPFMDHPVILQKDEATGEMITVQPIHWAQAFLQMDIKSVAITLSSAVLSSEELQKRINKNNCIESFPSLKKIVIMKASKWLMNKNQDPWSFDPKSPKEWPSKEEEEMINEGLKTFSIKNVNPLSTHLSEINNMDTTTSTDQDQLWNEIFQIIDDTCFQQISSSTSNDSFESEIGLLMEEWLLTLDYQEVFNRVIEFKDKGHTSFINLGNPAQIARELTKIVIKQNTDIFVDAVQFSVGRWSKAFLDDDLFNTADILFRKIYKLDFIDRNKTFNCFQDVCPVKRLAIFRAVAWLRWVKTVGQDHLDFNSAIPSHNLFLLPEEILHIERQISKKYGTFQDIIMENAVAAVPPLPFPQPDLSITKVIQSQQQQHSPVAIVQPNNFQDLIKFPANNNQQVPVSIPIQGLSSLYPQFNAEGHIVLNETIIKRHVWSTAYARFNKRSSLEQVQIGKYLFEETFTDQEIRNGNFSGKGTNKTPFCPKKVNAVIDSIAILKTLHEQDLGALPSYSSNSTWIGVPLVSFSETERQIFITKIFTEHRRYLASKTNKNV